VKIGSAVNSHRIRAQPPSRHCLDVPEPRRAKPRLLIPILPQQPEWALHHGRPRVPPHLAHRPPRLVLTGRDANLPAGLALREQGKLDEALSVFDRNSFPFFRLTGLAITHQATGHAREAQAALDELVAKLSMNSAFQIAQVYAVRGEADAAFAWLERARVQHDEGLEFVRIDLLFVSLHADPRWRAFLHKMNLPMD
jgi:hypothetical protein